MRRHSAKFKVSIAYFAVYFSFTHNAFLHKYEDLQIHDFWLHSRTEGGGYFRFVFSKEL